MLHNMYKLRVLRAEKLGLVWVMKFQEMLRVSRKQARITDQVYIKHSGLPNLVFLCGLHSRRFSL